MLSFTKCRSCKREVPPRSNECPHCHTKYPVIRIENIIASVVFIIVIGWIALSPSNEPEPTADPVVKTPEQIEQELIACRSDIDCWGVKHRAEANIQCDDHIEKQAAFDYEWTNSFMDLKFPQYRWLDQPHGWITYRGDSIKFQNEYGAWSNAIYECDFDTTKNLVISVRVQLGKI